MIQSCPTLLEYFEIYFLKKKNDKIYVIIIKSTKKMCIVSNILKIVNYLCIIYTLYLCIHSANFGLKMISYQKNIRLKIQFFLHTTKVYTMQRLSFDYTYTSLICMYLYVYRLKHVMFKVIKLFFI